MDSTRRYTSRYKTFQYKTLTRVVGGAAASVGLTALLSGCAGTGYGDFNRSTGGDISNGYNSTLAASGRANGTGTASGLGRGSFPMISTSFQLTNLPGDPFDYERVNVQVTLRRSDKSTVEVPAFYDGNDTWRMRYTPTIAGSYAVETVKLNGQIAHEQKMEKKDWTVNSETQPGFVRLDKGDHTRFVFDNGARYYPLGHNQAWHSDKLPDIPDMFTKMHDAGENWSRVWMTHWDGKNLDWPIVRATPTAAAKSDSKEAKEAAQSTATKTESADKATATDKTAVNAPVVNGAAAANPITKDISKETPPKEKAVTPKPFKLGDIDLNAAQKWDAIVSGAEKNGIYFQMVLQHHGQYSSKAGFKNSSNVNSNWDENPYNSKNGGFLNSPEEFFSNAQARALTKRKLYYMISRWGYSPNILAWELFNEVQFTDAAKGKMDDQIALWHREMALFLRQFDGYRHLITTSSATALPLNSPIWETVDYIQTHTYPSDVLTALGGTETADTNGKKSDKKTAKADFIGEYGPANLTDNEGTALHQGLWASMMRNGTGAAQYWDWEPIETHDLYPHFKSASAFLTASGLPNHGSLVNTTLQVDCPQMTALRFGPGGGYGKATQDEFVVGKEGAPQGIDQYPTFLQGLAHRDMMPHPLTLHVRYAQAGTFAVIVEKIAKTGAHLKISVDGKPVERDFAAGAVDYTPKAEAATTTVDVPQGAHDITIENTGKDWAVIHQFALSNYTTALAASARVGKDFAVAWVYHRGNIYEPRSRESGLESVTGKILLLGLQPGKYRYTWWDTSAGRSIEANDLSIDKGKEGAEITTPAIKFDVALYITKAGNQPARLKTTKSNVSEFKNPSKTSILTPKADEH